MWAPELVEPGAFAFRDHQVSEFPELYPPTFQHTHAWLTHAAKRDLLVASSTAASFGFNSGVMYFNLTGMRQAQWSEVWRQEVARFCNHNPKRKSVLLGNADQRIFNLMASQHPAWFLEVDNRINVGVLSMAFELHRSCDLWGDLVHQFGSMFQIVHGTMSFFKQPFGDRRGFAFRQALWAPYVNQTIARRYTTSEFAHEWWTTTIITKPMHVGVVLQTKRDWNEWYLSLVSVMHFRSSCDLVLHLFGSDPSVLTFARQELYRLNANAPSVVSNKYCLVRATHHKGTLAIKLHVFDNSNLLQVLASLTYIPSLLLLHTRSIVTRDLCRIWHTLEEKHSYESHALVTLSTATNALVMIHLDRLRAHSVKHVEKQIALFRRIRVDLHRQVHSTSTELGGVPWSLFADQWEWATSPLTENDVLVFNANPTMRDLVRQDRIGILVFSSVALPAVLEAVIRESLYDEAFRDKLLHVLQFQ